MFFVNINVYINRCSVIFNRHFIIIYIIINKFESVYPYQYDQVTENKWTKNKSHETKQF